MALLSFWISTELSALFRSEVGLTTIFQLIKSWFATGSENIFRFRMQFVVPVQQIEEQIMSF